MRALEMLNAGITLETIGMLMVANHVSKLFDWLLLKLAKVLASHEITKIIVPDEADLDLLCARLQCIGGHADIIVAMNLLGCR